VGFGHGEPHYFAHWLDLTGDHRFRQLLEFLDPVGISGDDQFARGITLDDPALYVQAAVGHSLNPLRSALPIGFHRASKEILGGEVARGERGPASLWRRCDIIHIYGFLRRQFTHLPSRFFFKSASAQGRPFTSTRPFGIRKIHSDPGFQSDPTLRPKKYGKDILEDKREFHTPTKTISRVSSAQASLAPRKGDCELYKPRELVRM
jgi:hypothetical protein